MSLLLTYLTRVRDIKESGIASVERSYYPALDTLFNTLGATLSPKVLAIHDKGKVVSSTLTETLIKLYNYIVQTFIVVESMHI
jgi:hypothetical protein